jgi:hypothetical protein
MVMDVSRQIRWTPDFGLERELIGCACTTG